MDQINQFVLTACPPCRMTVCTMLQHNVIKMHVFALATRNVNIMRKRMVYNDKCVLKFLIIYTVMGCLSLTVYRILSQHPINRSSFSDADICIIYDFALALQCFML